MRAKLTVGYEFEGGTAEERRVAQAVVAAHVGALAGVLYRDLQEVLPGAAFEIGTPGFPLRPFSEGFARGGVPSKVEGV